jgi:hypothetical protein
MADDKEMEGPTGLDFATRDVARSGITMFCDTTGGAVSLLPNNLSVKAASELQRICTFLSGEAAKITVVDQKDARRLRGLEQIMLGRLGDLSEETKKELANALVDAMRQGGYAPQTDPSAGKRAFGSSAQSELALGYSGPSASSAVASRYKDTAVPGAKLRIRFGSASHTDVHLLIDADPVKLMMGDKAFGGVKVHSKTDLKLGPTLEPLQVEGTVRIDMTTSSPSVGGYIGVKWSW